MHITQGKGWFKRHGRRWILPCPCFPPWHSATLLLAGVTSRLRAPSDEKHLEQSTGKESVQLPPSLTIFQMVSFTLALYKFRHNHYPWALHHNFQLCPHSSVYCLPACVKEEWKIHGRKEKKRSSTLNQTRLLPHSFSSQMDNGVTPHLKRDLGRGAELNSTFPFTILALWWTFFFC